MSLELHGWQRYATVLTGMVATGAVFSVAIPFTIAARGVIGPTALQAESAAGALLAIVISLALASLIAGLVGRLVNAAVGLFVLGAGLWVLRLRSGTIRDLAFADGSLGQVALETALWAGLVLVATLVVFRIAGPLADIVADDTSGDAGPTGRSSRGHGIVRGAAAGVVVIPIVYLVARSDLAGQTLTAVLLGSMLAGLFGRLLAPHTQPWLLFASPCLFGALGHLAGLMMLHGSLSEAFVAQALPALSRPMPIDYAAGSLMGVAMGLGWATSFLHHEETAAQE